MTEPKIGLYPDGYQPSPIGSPRRTLADGLWTLVLTRDFAHPVKRVWEALTEPGQLRQWAPFTADRDLAATGEVVITMLDGDDASAEVEQHGVVLASEPPRLLIFRWEEDVLRWELTSTEDGTTLVLSHTLAEDGLSSAVAAGWHLCFDAVDALMKDVPIGPVTGSQAKAYGWDDLNLRYAQIFGVKPSFT